MLVNNNSKNIATNKVVKRKVLLFLANIIVQKHDVETFSVFNIANANAILRTKLNNNITDYRQS